MSRLTYLVCSVCGQVEERDAETIEDLVDEGAIDPKTYECTACSAEYDICCGMGDEDEG